MLDGASGEEDSTDEENDTEEQSVNDKAKDQETMGNSRINDEENAQCERNLITSEDGGSKQIMSPNSSNVLPQAKPNIATIKPIGGTDATVKAIGVQDITESKEDGIVKNRSYTIQSHWENRINQTHKT